MEKIIIRPAEISDAKDFHELRIMPGVFENMMSLPFETLSDAEKFLREGNAPSLVAEIGGRFAGTVSLFSYNMERRKHCAILGLMVHKDFQGQGVGRTLMNAILDAADNWLMLKRIELEVFTDNERAIKLYKSLGFVIEGTEKFAAIKNGKYSDMYFMARYKNE